MIAGDVVRDVLVKLEDENGCLTPELLVEKAAKANHPLHDCFEWDDSAAAKSWRIEQARALIRSVRLVVTIDKVEFSTVRYVRDPRVSSEEQGYVGIPSALQDADLAQQIIRQEFSRAEAALQRAEDVAKALGVEHVIAKARKQLARSSGQFEKQVEHRPRV